jgi:hypothetical protein
MWHGGVWATRMVRTCGVVKRVAQQLRVVFSSEWDLACALGWFGGERLGVEGWGCGVGVGGGGWGLGVGDCGWCVLSKGAGLSVFAQTLSYTRTPNPETRRTETRNP